MVTGGEPVRGKQTRLVGMPEITTEQVAHLAELSRIALQPDELEHLTTELQQIVSAVEAVNKVATPDVPATSHPIPLTNVFRPDVVQPSLTPEQALSDAPDAQDNMFKVPTILGGE